ncbi:hypothetical protein LTR10_013005 [Elasticomyces elasticus]|nr:hypothetical protein LTR10_013005 [Elasticomyces elasticus]KAK4978574.1 hypothetical protein LTR42_001074 [Elasticomyces elasticus]
MEDAMKLLESFPFSDGRDTILHECIRHARYRQLADTILAHIHTVGLNIDETDDEGRTALHIAAETNSIVLVRQLLSAGASVSVKDALGNSPLHSMVLSRAYDLEFFETLPVTGADVCSQNLAGDSPLRLLVGRLAGVQKQEESEEEEAERADIEFMDTVELIGLSLQLATDQQVVQDEKSFTLFIEKILLSVDHFYSRAQVEALRRILVGENKKVVKEMLGVFVLHDAFDQICPLRVLVETVDFPAYDPIPEHYSYALAEILLEEDEGSMFSREENEADMPGCLFVHHPLTRYLQYLELDYALYLGIHLDSGYGTRKGNVDIHQIRTALYYVHDTLTRQLISYSWPVPGMYRSRVMAAIHIRRALGLDDVLIDSASLLRWMLDPIKAESEEAILINYEAVRIDELANKLRPLMRIERKV